MMKATLLVALAVCLVAAGGAEASLTINSAATYTDAQDAGNGYVRIGTTGSDFTVTLQGDGEFTNIGSGSFVQIGRAEGGGQNVRLLIDGASQPDIVTTLVVSYKSGATGILEVINGGSAIFGNSNNYIGWGAGTGYGTLKISGSGSSLTFGGLKVGNEYNSLTGTGYVIHEGGTVSVTGNLTMGIDNTDTGSSGTYTISGGSLSVGGSLDLDESGSALFHVKGSGATSISAGYLPTNATGTTLKFTVDSGGVSVISVGTLSILSGTVDMELDAFTPDANTWYDLVVRSGSDEINIDNLGLASGDETLWTLGTFYDEGADEFKVQAGYMIPEPATLGLVGLGLLGLVLRRKR